MSTLSRVRTRITDEILAMPARQHLVYWVLPALLLGTLLFFFFSGVPALENIVNPPRNKEWGLLENIQLLIVAAILVLATHQAFRKKPGLQKFGFAMIAAFSTFVFLEEIDYGAHLAHFLTGQKESQLEGLIGVYNIHNSGTYTSMLFKRVIYVLMLMLFIILPLIRDRLRIPLLQYLVPRISILTVAGLTIACELIARFLAMREGLTSNFEEVMGIDIGEFSEIMVYYTFLIYVWQLAFDKAWPETKKGEPLAHSARPT